VLQSISAMEPHCAASLIARAAIDYTAALFFVLPDSTRKS
jgi:hypothetical protein